MERFNNPKLIAALIVAALAAIVFFQNQQEVTLSVLFLYEVKTKVATALATAFLVGIVTGFLAFSRWHSKRQQAKDKSAP